MSRLSKAEQIIELAVMFQNSYSGLCIDDIQAHFECSRRSAERMKTVLFDMYPGKVEEVPSNGKKKRWRFVKTPINPLISFNVDDFVNLEYLKALSNDEERKKQLDELIGKIKSLNPQKNQRSLDTDIEAIMESEGFAVRQYSRIKIDRKILDDLRLAMLSFKKVRFMYNVHDNEREFVLHPYGLIIAERYFLVGFSEYVNDIRLYRLDRIKDLTVLEEYFEKDESFSLTKYSENSFGVYQQTPLDVTLEFDKSVAEDALNYHFHPTQKIKKLENGNVRVRFTAGGTHAIFYNLFKWGSAVKIKKPAQLKEEYKQYLSDVLNNL